MCAVLSHDDSGESARVEARVEASSSAIVRRVDDASIAVHEAADVLARVCGMVCVHLASKERATARVMQEGS